MSLVASKMETSGIARHSLYTTAERGRLDPELLVPSRIGAYVQVVGNIGVLVGLLALVGVSRSRWELVALYVAIGFALHRLFFPVHDCLHYSLFPTRSENRIFGALLAGLLGTSFEAIRDQHMDHHRDFGTPGDPGAADYFPRFRSRREFVSFLSGPLVGSIVFTKVGDYLLRPSRNSTQSEGTAPIKKANAIKRLTGYATILCVQAAVCALVTGGFQPSLLWRYPVFNVFPAVTIFLFLVRLRMFLEHGSLNYEVCDYGIGKRPTARTIYGSCVERILLCGSNFNFHHEHHLYPVVPGCQLPRLHRKLLASGLDSEDVRRTYVQALAEIWKNLGKNTPAPPVEPSEKRGAVGAACRG